MNIAKIPQPKHELGESYCSEIASARKCSALLRELGRERREAIQVSLRISILNDDASPFNVSEFTHTLAECVKPGSLRRSRGSRENPSQGTFVAAAPRREN